MYDATRCVPTPTLRPLPLSLHNIRNASHRAYAMLYAVILAPIFVSDFQCATASLFAYFAQLPTAIKFAFLLYSHVPAPKQILPNCKEKCENVTLFAVFPPTSSNL